MFSSSDLAIFFPSKQLGTSLFAFQELTSTNSFALDLVRNNPQDGTLILANSQSDGRGRMDRQWFSPPGMNIYASLIKRFHGANTQIQDSGWIPPLAGLAIAMAIEETTALSLALKWPNDILIQEQKVGGILCESTTDSEGIRWVVIGFGINVNLAGSMFPPHLQEIATSLHKESGSSWDRLTLLHQITGRLEDIFATLADSESSNYQKWKETYHDRCSTIGKVIQVQFPDGSTLTGLAKSIGDHGQLQVCPMSSMNNPQSDRILDIYSGDILHIQPAASI